LGAPNSRATIWTIPDYSFEDASFANRRVQLPGLIGGLRTDEVQCFNLDGIVESGTFRLTLGSETTGTLAWNASAGAVKAALEALAAVAYNDVEVTRGPSTQEVQIFEVRGATGGSFTLTFAGQTTGLIPWNANDFQVWSALNDLPAIGLFDLSITSKVTNEVQSVKLVGEPTGGTFTLTFDGETTGDIPWNANAVQVYGALIGLDAIDIFDITVNHEWWKPYAPWTIGFNMLGTKYSGVDVPTISGSADNLSGGAGMDVVVSVDTEGSRPFVAKFRGARSGQNVPELIINPGGLTAHDTSKITTRVVTDVPGSHPYIVRFRNNLSGQSFPLLSVNTSGLTGYGGVGARSWKQVEGYTAPAENCVIDVDPRVEQVVSESGSTLWGRMNGVRLRHPIPPYTGAKTFVVTVSGAVAGQMVSLHLPRPWSRPWGLD